MRSCFCNPMVPVMELPGDQISRHAGRKRAPCGILTIDSALHLAGRSVCFHSRVPAIRPFAMSEKQLKACAFHA